MAAFLVPLQTSAASLTSLSDTMSRLVKSTASNHTIEFTTPTGVDSASATISVTFPAGFSIGSVDYTDIDLSHGASTGAETEETLAASASASAWGAVFSSQVLTLTHPTNAANGDIAAGDKVIVEIGTNATAGTTGDQQITNDSTAATYTISIATSPGDSGKLAIVVLDGDQTVVNATVDPTLTFTISATTTNFGILSIGSVVTSSPNITLEVGTNSASGYTITLKDQGNSTNPGLYNTNASKLIGSANATYDDVVTLSNGTEGYGVQASSATATIGARYDGAGDEVGSLEVSGSLPTLASYASHPSATHTITVSLKAAIATTTEAGAYTDTLTYIATGNF